MNYATGYALNVNELMEDFPAKKAKMTSKECEAMIGSRNKDRVASKVFRACIALVLDDIIENSDTFQLPTSSKKCEIYMKRIEDEDFVKAVINQESGFNPNATSHCGAMGLMQLMPSTAQGLGVTNAYDAEQNIEGGTKYLKGLMDRFGNDKSLALAAYNAGPNAVKKYGGIPPYAETKNYVKSVLSKYDTYKGAN